MTRREFMTRLESCLTCVEKSEREAALRYYEEYFDDAGAENEAGVISSLGSPEALAREIIAEAGKAGEAKAEAGPSSGVGNSAEFHSIKAELVNANFSILIGSAWAVDIFYPEYADLPKISIANDTLYINEEKKIFRWNFGRTGSWKPGRIEITVPDVQFRDFNIENVNGTMLIPAIRVETLHCETVNGNVTVDGVRADTIIGENVNGNVNLVACRAARKCSAKTVNGGVTIGGELHGLIKAEAVNGSLRISSALPLTEYDVDVETLSGSVRINGEKHRKEVHISNHAENTIKASAINGSVSIDFMR